jgi:hypothetical protein
MPGFWWHGLFFNYFFTISSGLSLVLSSFLGFGLSSSWLCAQLRHLGLRLLWLCSPRPCEQANRARGTAGCALNQKPIHAQTLIRSRVRPDHEHHDLVIPGLELPDFPVQLVITGTNKNNPPAGAPASRPVLCGHTRNMLNAVFGTGRTDCGRCNTV